jgi:hypothetical protein
MRRVRGTVGLMRRREDQVSAYTADTEEQQQQKKQNDEEEVTRGCGG